MRGTWHSKWEIYWACCMEGTHYVGIHIENMESHKRHNDFFKTIEGVISLKIQLRENSNTLQQLQKKKQENKIILVARTRYCLLEHSRRHQFTDEVGRTSADDGAIPHFLGDKEGGSGVDNDIRAIGLLPRRVLRAPRNKEHHVLF